VNWTDASGVGTADTNTQTISGINTQINLRVSCSGGALANYQYSLNGGNWTALYFSEDETITVSNGDTLRFSGTAAYGGTSTFTVVNQSDGNATLDTFVISLAAVPGAD
jgi:hypothetical protein